MSEKTSTFAIIAFIVFVDSLGIGLILPVMPDLIAEITHEKVREAAVTGGYLLFVYAGMQFLFAPVIGGLSDKFGRRPVLLLTLLLLALDYTMMALTPSLIWLFVGRAVSGVLGATWAAANSSIADLMQPEERGKAFGILSGAGAAGFVLGPALGGLAGGFGTRVPFAIAAGLALVGTIIGFFMLAESLPPDQRRRFSIYRSNPFGSIAHLARAPFLLDCLIIIFLMQLAVQAQFSIWAYWGQVNFGWTAAISGLTISLYGILLGISQAVLTGKSIARFGEARTAKFALLFGLPSYILLATAASNTPVLIAIVIGALSGMTFPALLTLMTARVEGDAQGELQGAVASTISMASIVGPIVMTQTFSHFSDRAGTYFPGAPYIVSLALLSLAAILLWRALGRDGNRQSALPQKSNSEVHS